MKPLDSPPPLALSMIVKNAEGTLARCLDSVREVAGEIVIADTGSTDRSIEIAREYQARVFSIPWERDFAKARNLALAQVKAEWVLMLDADEVLDSEAGKLIPAHLSKDGVMGYTVHIKNYLGNANCHLWDQQAKPNISPPPFARDYPAYVEHVNVRLFRHHPEIFFQGRVHETVGYRILDLGMWIDEATFYIHHLGFIEDDETLAKKYIFYRDLGREKAVEMPENALAHFELGVEEFEHFHNYSGALAPFKRACELNPRLGVAWLFYGRTLGHLGKHREGLAALEHAEDTGAKMEMILESRGDIHYSLGEFAEAFRSYQQAAGLQVESALIESKLGFTEVRLGRHQEGLAHLQHAVEREPLSAELYDRMITACAWLGKPQQAAVAAEMKIEKIGPQPDFYLRAASLRAQAQDWQRVVDLLRQGLDHFPKNEKLQTALAESGKQSLIAGAETQGDAALRGKNFALAMDCYLRAIECLGSLPRLESKLGLAEVLLGQPQTGTERLRRAVEREPRSGDLHDRLIAACAWLGQIQEAARAAEHKLSMVEPRPEFFLRAASLYAQLQGWQRAAALVREGLARFPDDESLRRATAETDQHLAGGARVP
ncbi:MAG: glycosyltransferase [Terriglobia bacterium]